MSENDWWELMRLPPLGDIESHMVIQVLAIVVLGLMCGSELNVAAFGHPTLNRQSTDVHIPVRASFAVLLGRVMPFWMVTSTLLNLLLLLPIAHLGVFAGHLAQMAFAIQVFAILFSLLVLCLSTTASSSGRPPISPPTGAHRSIAGISITGSAPVASSSPSFCWSSARCTKLRPVCTKPSRRKLQYDAIVSIKPSLSFD